jgi:hypothetical protein
MQLALSHCSVQLPAWVWVALWYAISLFHTKFGAIGATVATLMTYFVVVILVNFLFSELKPVGRLIIRSLNLYQAALRITGLVR